MCDAASVTDRAVAAYRSDLLRNFGVTKSENQTDGKTVLGYKSTLHAGNQTTT